MKRAMLYSLMVALIITSPASAGDRKPVFPSAEDKCAVCGMFVAKYMNFVAQITFKDSSYAVFDGAKDMFKYYFNMKKYNAPKEVTDIEMIYVTNYYSTKLIDGREAFFVAESKVYGPMGKDLIPLPACQLQAGGKLEISL
jgi:copper chaperone NosL